MQETGASEDGATAADVARYLRLTLASTWAEGASGYFWWCSHDIKPEYEVRIPWPLPRVLGRAASGTGAPSPGEQRLGLLTADNREKPSAGEYRRLARLLRRAGHRAGKTGLPVAYVLAPATDDYFRTMLDLIQPFVLLKRTHVKVRVLHDGAPVPGGAAAVVDPRLLSTAAGRERVRSYLEAGGTVYQSLQNDFAPAMALGAPEDLADARVWLERGSGRASSDRFLTVPSRRVRGGCAPATASTSSAFSRGGPSSPARGASESRSSRGRESARGGSSTWARTSRRASSRATIPGARTRATSSTRRSCRRPRSTSTIPRWSSPTRRAAARSSSSSPTTRNRGRT